METLKAYILKYPGLWMGGMAVVLARNEKEAVDILVANTIPSSLGEKDATVIGIHELESGLIYNDNGDY